MSVPILTEQRFETPPYKRWCTEEGRPVWCSLPNKGSACESCKASTPEGALENGREYVRRYESRSFPGGMGEVLGVTEVEDGVYAPVISTYYSPS